MPAGLTLKADGTINGTPTGPAGTFSFTVQVTDSFPTTATANFSITVTGKIQGNYAFSFNGYNQQGQAFYIVGSLVADGSGNITSGVFDRNGNDAIGPMTNVAITRGTGANGQCPIASTATGFGLLRGPFGSHQRRQSGHHSDRLCAGNLLLQRCRVAD